MIDPTANCIFVLADAVDFELARPAVVRQGQHRRMRPVVTALEAIDQLGCDGIVTIGKDIGFDDNTIAHHALNRKSPRIDLRLDALDDYAEKAVFQQRPGWVGNKSTRT